MSRREQPDPVARERFARVWPAVDQDFDMSAADQSIVDVDSLRPAPRPSTGDGSVSSLPSTALAALNPGRRAIKALAVLAVVVVLIAAFVAWHSRPHAEVITAVAESGQPSITVATTTPTLTTAVPTSASGTATIVVAVTGRVRHPGLVTVPVGARVADAIAAAGGALPGTDLAFVNLARKVSDGELIVIGVAPSPGEAADPTGGSSPAAGGAGSGPVDLNTAGLSELETLPGIGPSLAQRILDYRTQHGNFRSVTDLQNVSGIGPSKYAAIKDLVTT